MTGVEINRIYEQQIGQPYSGIEDVPKKNRRFRRALINSIKLKYRGLNEHIEFTELKSVIKTDVSFTPSAGRVNLYDNSIEYILAVAATYYKKVPGVIQVVSVSLAPNSAPIIQFRNPLRLRTGSRIRITSMPGTVPPGAIAEVYLKRVSVYKYGMYTDSSLTTPFAAGGPFVSGSQIDIKEVAEAYCFEIKSDEKISTLKSPSEYYPAYQVSDEGIAIYPYSPAEGVIPVLAKIDYISRSVVFFNLEDNVIEYLETYNEGFINHIIDEAAKSFHLDFKDYNAAGAQDREIMINP